MDGERPQSPARLADADLASVRNGLLIIAQTAALTEVPAVREGLERLARQARQNSHPRVEALVSRCRAMVSALGNGGSVPARAYKTLDIVAAIEAELLKIAVGTNGFLDDVSEFVDSSFAGLAGQPTTEAHDTADELFEVDAETLEVFRCESDGLLSNVEDALTRLSETPSDQNTLWEIRRNAHTLKGAAGIVGLVEAARIAHRTEDLLDRLVDARRDADASVIGFLRASAQALADICHSRPQRDPSALDAQYAGLMASVAAVENTAHDAHVVATHQDRFATPTSEPSRSSPGPIVRVSLDRLDELLKVAGRLALTGAELDEKFTDVLRPNGTGQQGGKKLDSLIATTRRLTADIQEKLMRIRMVRFGTLETRLSRAIHVTCLDENKMAALELDGPEVEIDTQIIDALIEPLLHLLKNAVVHGIESPETRRMLGKPEAGKVRVAVEADDSALVLSVTDDGAGISLAKLKEKAVANGLLDRAAAAEMHDRDAIKLIFDRGLTTAEKLDLNAGRGVGMSIVKESVEARGGTVIVESKPHAGTTFTILMPVGLPHTGPVEDDEAAPNGPLILIVDDSSVVRRQMQRLVEKAGSTAITAENGADALELLLNGDHEPDLIISDIEMPQIDGWAFLEYIKTDANFGHIPVVVMTSLSGDEHRSRAFELGATDYIVKPFNVKDLERIFAAVGGLPV